MWCLFKHYLLYGLFNCIWCNGIFRRGCLLACFTKISTLLGNKEEQGRMFGFLEAGRGLLMF